MLKPLTATIHVAPQIGVEDIAEAAALGVSLVINNRPDGESPDQPPGAAIEAAARGAGMAYVAIPVTHAGFAPWQIDALDAAMAEAGQDARVLMFCRSGTRSTLLWALSRARAGDDPETIAETAALAGYDVTPIRPIIDALAAEAR
jgi:uncharacterized protein (TIGR01244 family)